MHACVQVPPRRTYIARARTKRTQNFVLRNKTIALLYSVYY